MTLKSIIETEKVKENLELEIIDILKESFIEVFKDYIITEGAQDKNIMNACRSDNGIMLLTGTDDSLLLKALVKLKTTNWSTISSKNECVAAIMNKLYDINSSCDITIDNPDVKSKIVKTMENLWKQAILKVSKYQISEPNKALNDLKSIFVAAFKKMKENL